MRDPASPKEIAAFNLPGFGLNIDVAGDYMYVTDHFFGEGGGLYIFRLLGWS